MEGAHGSGFDRVSGFYAGFTGGVGSCRDDFGDGRIFTARAFEDAAEESTEGNAPYEDIGGIVDVSLPRFYDSWFPQVTDDSAAPVSTVCLTGWYTARFFDGDFADVTTLSPGDVDEAIIFLLAYGQTDTVLSGVEASGLELVGAFRDGFLQGGTACDLGI